MAMYAYETIRQINFNPGETITVNATTSSGSAAFSKPLSAKNTDCTVANVGSVTAFVAFGLAANGVTAQVPPGLNATPVPAGAIMTLYKGNADTCAAITGTGSTTVYFTAGNGS